MAEDADNTDVQASGADITPEDFDGEQEAPKTDSSPEESSEAKDSSEAKSEKPEKPEAADKADESGDDSDDSSEADDAEGKDDADKGDDAADKSKPKGADARKDELNTEIRDLVARRNALKKEVAEKNSEVYQPATEKELVEQGMDPVEAKLEAFKQEQAVRDYNDQVAEAQLTLESESDRVLRDFAWANPDNESFNKELAEEAAELLGANLVVDKNTGQVVGSNISPYQLYKTLDRAAAATTTKGRLEGQKDTEAMLANADAGASASPAKKPKDPLEDIWKDPL